MVHPPYPNRRLAPADRTDTYNTDEQNASTNRSEETENEEKYEMKEEEEEEKERGGDGEKEECLYRNGREKEIELNKQIEKQNGI